MADDVRDEITNPWDMSEMSALFKWPPPVGDNSDAREHLKKRKAHMPQENHQTLKPDPPQDVPETTQSSSEDSFQSTVSRVNNANFSMNTLVEHTRSRSPIHIDLQTEKPLYKAGESVNGFFEIHVEEKDIYIGEIYLDWRGAERVKRHLLSSGLGSVSMSSANKSQDSHADTTETREVNATRIYYQGKGRLTSRAVNSKKKLRGCNMFLAPRRTTRYNFTIDLPQDLPSSFEAKFVDIVYEMRVQASFFRTAEPQKGIPPNKKEKWVSQRKTLQIVENWANSSDSFYAQKVKRVFRDPSGFAFSAALPARRTSNAKDSGGSLLPAGLAKANIIMHTDNNGEQDLEGYRVSLRRLIYIKTMPEVAISSRVGDSTLASCPLERGNSGDSALTKAIEEGPITIRGCSLFDVTYVLRIEPKFFGEERGKWHVELPVDICHPYSLHTTGEAQNEVQLNPDHAYVPEKQNTSSDIPLGNLSSSVSETTDPMSSLGSSLLAYAGDVDETSNSNRETLLDFNSEGTSGTNTSAEETGPDSEKKQLPETTLASHRELEKRFKTIIEQQQRTLILQERELARMRLSPTNPSRVNDEQTSGTALRENSRAAPSASSKDGLRVSHPRKKILSVVGEQLLSYAEQLWTDKTTSDESAEDRLKPALDFLELPNKRASAAPDLGSMTNASPTLPIIQTDADVGKAHAHSGPQILPQKELAPETGPVPPKEPILVKRPMPATDPIPQKPFKHWSDIPPWKRNHLDPSQHGPTFTEPKTLSNSWATSLVPTHTHEKPVIQTFTQTTPDFQLEQLQQRSRKITHPRQQHFGSPEFSDLFSSPNKNAARGRMMSSTPQKATQGRGRGVHTLESLRQAIDEDPDITPIRLARKALADAMRATAGLGLNSTPRKDEGTFLTPEKYGRRRSVMTRQQRRDNVSEILSQYLDFGPEQVDGENREDLDMLADAIIGDMTVNDAHEGYEDDQDQHIFQGDLVPSATYNTLQLPYEREVSAQPDATESPVPRERQDHRLSHQFTPGEEENMDDWDGSEEIDEIAKDPEPEVEMNTSLPRSPRLPTDNEALDALTKIAHEPPRWTLRPESAIQVWNGELSGTFARSRISRLMNGDTSAESKAPTLPEKDAHFSEDVEIKQLHDDDLVLGYEDGGQWIDMKYEDEIRPISHANPYKERSRLEQIDQDKAASKSSLKTLFVKKKDAANSERETNPSQPEQTQGKHKGLANFFTRHHAKKRSEVEDAPMAREAGKGPKEKSSSKLRAPKRNAQNESPSLVNTETHNIQGAVLENTPSSPISRGPVSRKDRESSNKPKDQIKALKSDAKPAIGSHKRLFGKGNNKAATGLRDKSNKSRKTTGALKGLLHGK